MRLFSIQSLYATWYATRPQIEITKDVRSYILEELHRQTVTCPKCSSRDITDYLEFGCPGGYRYFCNDCKNLWRKFR